MVFLMVFRVFKGFSFEFRPFKLRNPKGGFVAKRHPYYAGGDWGNREEKISDLVHKMI